MNIVNLVSTFITQLAEVECIHASPLWPLYCSAAARLLVKSILEEDQFPGVLMCEHALCEARPTRGSQTRRRMKRSDVIGLTQVEVARILGMSERGVREVEKRALRKLRAHPELRQFWAQYGSELEECFTPLTLAEVEALFQLAETPQELGLLYRIISTIQ